MSLSIIIPSRNSANLTACVSAIRRMGETCRIIVIDDGLETRPDGCEYIPGVSPFVFSRNVNLGIQAAGDDDVCLVNDDTLLATPHGFTELQRIAQERPEYGLIAASTNHAGNLRQMNRPTTTGFVDEPEYLCFVCVFIPRRTIDAVGLLDERFASGYGWEDRDMSRRVLNAGLKLGISLDVFVDHMQLRSTYRTQPGIEAAMKANEQIYREKWENNSDGKRKMHDSVMAWVGRKVQQYALNDPAFKVLEVGSRDVNGTVRPLFSGVCSYAGLDMQAGPGVDVVANSHLLSTDAIKSIEPPYDVVVSTEMLEHDAAFWRSLQGMGKVLKPGGYLLLTARGNGFPKHDYPHDMYRFTTESFRFLIEDVAQCDVLEVIEDPGPPGVFGLGRRRI